MSDIPARENTNIALFRCFPQMERIHLQHATKRITARFLMRTSIFAACLALLLAAGTCKGQPARIFLAAEKETTIKLFGTVDGAFQPFHHALREFTLTPGSESAAIIASLERQRKGRATEHARDDGRNRNPRRDSLAARPLRPLLPDRPLGELVHPLPTAVPVYRTTARNNRPVRQPATGIYFDRQTGDSRQMDEGRRKTCARRVAHPGRSIPAGRHHPKGLSKQEYHDTPIHSARPLGRNRLSRPAAPEPI